MSNLTHSPTLPSSTHPLQQPPLLVETAECLLLSSVYLFVHRLDLLLLLCKWYTSLEFGLPFLWITCWIPSSLELHFVCIIKEPFMAIGDKCCLGVSNEEAIRRTTDPLLVSETVDTSFEGVGGGLHWEEPTVCTRQHSSTATKKKNKEVVASENGDLQNNCSAVTCTSGNSQIHTGSEKENQNCSSTESEPMCASGIVCSGVKPCSMSNLVLTVSGCSATGHLPASVGIVDSSQVVEKINIDNDAEVDAELENLADVACPETTEQKEKMTNDVVGQMEIDDQEPNNSETQEKMAEEERSISPDEEGSKCSQSSDNGYASDSSNSDASDELSQTKSADEDSSSSDDDESSPDDSPSPPSADESSPFPCVEEVETRTGISFERTLNNSSQNDNCSSFSFPSSSGNGMFGHTSSGAGYANYGNVNEAACERAQLRSRVMRLLDGGVRLIDDSERCLRRYVLLKTNLNRLRKEVRDERLGVHRRRRHQVMAQGFTEALSSGSGMTVGPRGSIVSAPNSGFPYGVPNSISPLAGQIPASSRSASGGFTTTCTVSSSNSSCANRPLATDENDEEPPMKRPRYAAEENKENYGSSGSLFLTSMHQYASEASGFYSTTSGHYTSVCNNSNGGYYSTSSQSMYCMNHLTNHYSSSSTNYFTNSHFGGGSSTQYMSSFNCSGSQTNNDRISNNNSSSSSSSSSSNSNNSISGGNLSNANNTSYSSSCAQVDSFSSSVTSGNDACSSSASGSNSNVNNGGFYNASNVTSNSCSGVGLRSNLETIIEAIDQQILRGSYDAGTSRPISNGNPHASSFGSFSSYSTGGGFFDGSSDNQRGSHIFSNTEGSSYHIFGNNRHSTSNSVFGDSNSSNYSMSHSSTSYNSTFSSSSSPYSDGSSSSLAPQNPCGRSQLPGNDFQSLVYSSLMASLES
ncbi:hypothetical protein FHG87_010217 [Trinorchestia longiramus]|nr:hypothetical protein FHG87_010217 [Trinorchestia longiramus]